MRMSLQRFVALISVLISGCPPTSLQDPTPNPTPITGCSDASECPGGELCIDGICRQPEMDMCQTDADCGSDQLCVSGACQLIAFGPADPAKSTIELSREEAPADDVETIVVTVTLRDERDQVPAASLVQLDVAGEPAQATTSDGAGVARFTLHAKVVGDKTLALSVHDAGGTIALGSRLIHFVRAHADAALSTIVFSREDTIVADGIDFTEATIVLSTAAGGVPYGTTVSLETDAVATFATTGAIDDTGMVKLKVRARAAGSKTLRAVTDDAITLDTQPAVSFIQAAVIPATSTVSLDMPQASASLSAGVTLSLVVYTVSNGVTRDATVEIAVTGADNSVEAVALTAEEAVSSRWLLSSTKAEAKEITITVNGVVLPAVDVTIVPAVADADASSLTLDHKGMSPAVHSLATVRSLDAFGNIRAADVVGLSAGTGSVTVTPIDSETDVDGYMHFDIAADSVGDRTLTATWPGGTPVLTVPLRVYSAWRDTASNLGFIDKALMAAADPTDPQRFFVMRDSDKKVWETLDGGQSFHLFMDGVPGTVTAHAISASKQAPLKLWLVGTGSGGGFYTRETGTWQKLASGPPANEGNMNWHSNVFADNGNRNAAWYVTNYCVDPCDDSTSVAEVRARVYRFDGSGWYSWVFNSWGSISSEYTPTPLSSCPNPGARRLLLKQFIPHPSVADAYSVGLYFDCYYASTLYEDNVGVFEYDPEWESITRTGDTPAGQHVRGRSIDNLATYSGDMTISLAGGASLAKNGDNLATFVPASGVSRWVAYTGLPNAPADFVGDAFLAATGKKVSFWDGTEWLQLVSPTLSSAISALDDTHLFTLIGTALYDLDLTTMLASSVTMDTEGNTITNPRKLFRQRLPADKRFLSADSGIYSRSAGTGWQKLAPAPTSCLADWYDAIAYDPESGDLYSRCNATTIKRYAASTWGDVTFGGSSAVASFHVDPRTPGVLVLKDESGACNLYRKAEGQTGWAAFGAACFAAVSWSGATAPAFVGFNTTVERAVLDGQATVWGSCASGLPALTGSVKLLADPSDDRHLVVSAESSVIYETYSGCE